MVAIRRWEPRRGFGRGHRHLDFWGPRMDLFHGWPDRGHNRFWAPVDILEEDGRLVLKAAVPGYKAEDFDLTVEDNILTIKGETKADISDDGPNYLHRERIHGEFRRSFRLPDRVDTAKGESAYQDGMLSISFPYREDMAPKQLKIAVGSGVADAS